MAAPVTDLPEGFVLDELPEGFTVDEPQERFVPEPFTRNPEYSPGVNPIAGNVEALVSGGSLGMSDEIQSFIAAAVASPFISDKTFGQIMMDARNQMREQAEQFREQEGVAAYVPEVIGGMVTGAKIPMAKTPGGKIGTAMTEGAIAGAGFADQPEFASVNTLAGAAGGAATAGALTAAGVGIGHWLKSRSAFKRQIAEQVESGRAVEGSLSRELISKAGKPVSDNAKEAIKQGFDEGVIRSIMDASPQDRQLMLRSLEILKRARKDADYAVIHRAGEVGGDSLLKRVQYIRTVNKSAGKEIGRVAKTLKGKPVNAGDSIIEFAEKLDEWGVELKRTDKGLIPNFENSQLGPGNRAPLKEIIRQMNRIARSGEPDALDAHQLKQIIDDNVTYGKNVTGMSARVDNALKDLRFGLKTALEESFPEYAKANKTYSETIQVLDDLQDSVGRKLDLSGPRADRALGIALRRLMGNMPSGTNLLTSVEEMERVAAKHGGKFDDNLIKLSLFADELETVAPPSSRTTFKSEVGKGVEKGLKEMGSKDATITGLVAEGGKRAVEALEGISEDNALIAIEKLLRN